MSDFHVGQEVVCVDDTGHPEWPANRAIKGREVSEAIRSGQHYIVRWVGEYLIRENGIVFVGLRLSGVDRLPKDTPFMATRFRPIRPESIAIFREMCKAKRKELLIAK